MLLWISEDTGMGCGAVSFGVFVSVIWEWRVGEKRKRAGDAAGASSSGGQKRRFDGHVLCAPLAQGPRSIVKLSS